jgi:membrane protein
MINKNKQVFVVLRFHLIESLRNYQILLTNIALPILFVITSLLVENNSQMDPSELSLLIHSQFFSTSLLFGILSYSFSQPLQNLVEIIEEQSDLVLSQTDLKYFNFILGKRLGDLLLLNFHVLFVILLFSSLKSVSDVPVLKILLISNLSFFIINPISDYIATKIKTVKMANNIGTLAALLLIFSLTFTNMFSTLSTNNFSMIEKILVINPMFGFYDSLNMILQEKEDFYFGSFVNNLTYMILYATIIFVIEYIYIYRKAGWSNGK